MSITKKMLHNTATVSAQIEKLVFYVCSRELRSQLGISESAMDNRTFATQHSAEIRRLQAIEIRDLLTEFSGDEAAIIEALQLALRGYVVA